MIKASIVFLFSALLFSCSNSSDPATGKDSVKNIQPVFSPGSSRDTIAKLENLHSRLILDGKGDSLLGMYSEDPQIMANQGTFYNGQQGVIDFWKANPPFLSHVRTMIKLEGNEDLLYETGIEAVSGTAKYGDQQFSYSSKYLVIWKRTKGLWKIALEMWNALPPVLPPSKTDDGD